MQYKFSDLESAKAKVKEIIGKGIDLEDSSLHIIESNEQGRKIYYVEDGCHMIRNHEKILWSL